MNSKVIAFLVIVVLIITAIWFLPGRKGIQPQAPESSPDRESAAVSAPSAMNPQPDSLKVQVQDSTGTDLATLTLVPHKSVQLPGTQYSLHLTDFYSHFQMQDNGPVNLSPHLENPAARIEIQRDGKTVDYSWTFKKVPYFRMSGMGGSPTAETTGLAFALLEVYGLEPSTATSSNP